MERISESTKKNLLDLQYSKYLQYYNTSIIILFTYFIGVSIAFVTKQVDIYAPTELIMVGALTIGVVYIITLLMLSFREHLRNIFDEIRKLEL